MKKEIKRSENIRSVLRKILNEVPKSSDCFIVVDEDFVRVKAIVIKGIQNSKINEKDKQSMLTILKSKKNSFDLTKSIYDLLLKYEGDGVIAKSLNGGKLRK